MGCPNCTLRAYERAVDEQQKPKSKGVRREESSVTESACTALGWDGKKGVRVNVKGMEQGDECNIFMMQSSVGKSMLKPA